MKRRGWSGRHHGGPHGTQGSSRSLVRRRTTSDRLRQGRPKQLHEACSRRDLHGVRGARGRTAGYGSGRTRRGWLRSLRTDDRAPAGANSPCRPRVSVSAHDPLSQHHVCRPVALRHSGALRREPLARQRRWPATREFLLRESSSRGGSDRGAAARHDRERRRRALGYAASRPKS